MNQRPIPLDQRAKQRCKGRAGEQFRIILSALVALGCAGVLCAQVEENPFHNPTAQPTNSTITQIAPDIFEIGLVRLNKKTRRVTLPAVLNMKEGAVEYLLVADTGKIHESVLRTAAQPYHVNLALLLLGARGAGTNAFSTNPPAIPGERLSLEVSWLTLEQEVRRPAERLVVHRETGEPLTDGPWVYNGSRIWEGTFIAQQDGSIIAIMLDQDAILNNPRPGAERDDLWLINTNGLPPLNWPVQITIQMPEPRK